MVGGHRERVIRPSGIETLNRRRDTTLSDSWIALTSYVRTQVDEELEIRLLKWQLKLSLNAISGIGLGRPHSDQKGGEYVLSKLPAFRSF